MNMMHLSAGAVRVIAAGSAWLAATACAAQPAPDAAPPPAGGGIGLGLFVQSRPYAGADTETRVLPLLSYENRWVRVAGLGADLKLGRAGPVSFAFGARYALNGFEADDAPTLAGMAERKGGLWVGPSVSWRTPWVNVSAEALGDASRHSEGRQFRLGFDRTFETGGLRITPRLVGLWRDQKYNNYYFGVRQDEVRVGRPLYEAASGTDVEYGLRFDYALQGRHSVFLDLSQVVYGRAVKDSPVVDESSAVGARLGYLYRF